MKKGMRRPGVSHHVIQGTDDITGSRHEDVFTSLATESFMKQDKLQLRNKSYLCNLSRSEAELLKDGSDAHVANPRVVAFLLHSLNFVTADISHMSFGHPLSNSYVFCTLNIVL